MLLVQGLRADDEQDIVAQCCNRAVAAGKPMYPSPAVPTDHVALRLEQCAAGEWPKHGQEPAADATRVPRSVKEVSEC